MTVNQLIRSYVKDQNGKRSYNRNAIHAELFSDVAKQIFSATKESKHQQDVEKAFNNAVDNIHTKFMNVYSGKENVDKEWKIFYATFIVPLKVLFGIIEIKLSDNLNVSRYTMIKLSEEQKEALVATGLNKPLLNETVINSQLSTLTTVIGDCISAYGINDKVELFKYKQKINTSKNVLIDNGMTELKIENFVEKKPKNKRPRFIKKETK